MATEQNPAIQPAPNASHPNEGTVLLGAALAFASLILVPALAPRLGLAPSLAGAVRMALMRASGRVITGTGDRAGDDAPAQFSCH